MSLSDAQRRAIRVGVTSRWLGTKESGIRGDTMESLARHGLAEVAVAKRPYRRLVYRLTPAGNALRVTWALARAYKPIAHERIAVRCPTCGWEFGDGTPGGSCGACGAAVELAA